MDILDDIYQQLKDDPFMSEYVGNRYMYNDFPDAKDITSTYITINPIVSGNPIDYADGRRIADAKSARVDVFVSYDYNPTGNPRTLCMELMERIATILDEDVYLQVASFAPENDKVHGIYRETRSFEINYYRSDY